MRKGERWRREDNALLHTDTAKDNALSASQLEGQKERGLQFILKIKMLEPLMEQIMRYKF